MIIGISNLIGDWKPSHHNALCWGFWKLRLYHFANISTGTAELNLSVSRVCAHLVLQLSHRRANSKHNASAAPTMYI